MTACSSSATCEQRRLPDGPLRRIERQDNPDLAIEYPDKAAADYALEKKFFIDALCQEDCLDAYTVSEILDGYEVFIPPDDDFDI